MRFVLGLVAGSLALAARGRGQTIPDSAGYAQLVAASGAAVDSGEFEPDGARQSRLFENAERYARRAIAANPQGADGHFALARALGRRALTLGVRDRIRYATEVRAEALAALAADTGHAGAMHILGEWNAEVMRLSGLSRLIARRFLGGKVFGQASWEEAVRYLEAAVARQPERIVHRLDLAAVYADRGLRARAIEEYEWIARAPPRDFNDANYKEVAARRLRDLR